MGKRSEVNAGVTAGAGFLRPLLYAACITAPLLLGLILLPRVPPSVSPKRLISQSLERPQNPAFPADRVRDHLRHGYTPILEGSDVISGSDCWAVRLKIPPPKRYPWIEVWIDKRTNRILAWKEWGKRGGRVKLLAQSPDL